MSLSLSLFIFFGFCFSLSLSVHFFYTQHPFPYSYTYFLSLFLLYLLCVAHMIQSLYSAPLFVSISALGSVVWLSLFVFVLQLCPKILDPFMGGILDLCWNFISIYAWGVGTEQEPGCHTGPTRFLAPHRLL